MPGLFSTTVGTTGGPGGPGGPASLHWQAELVVDLGVPGPHRYVGWWPGLGWVPRPGSPDESFRLTSSPNYYRQSSVIQNIQINPEFSPLIPTQDSKSLDLDLYIDIIDIFILPFILPFPKTLSLSSPACAA